MAHRAVICVPYCIGLESEIESETHLQAKLRAVFIHVPESCRFNRHIAREEEGIACLQPEATERAVVVVELIAIYAYATAKIHPHLVEIVAATNACTVHIQIASVGIPSTTQADQKGQIVHQERTALSLQTKRGLVASCIVRK